MRVENATGYGDFSEGSEFITLRNHSDYDPIWMINVEPRKLPSYKNWLSKTYGKSYDKLMDQLNNVVDLDLNPQFDPCPCCPKPNANEEIFGKNQTTLYDKRQEYVYIYNSSLNNIEFKPVY